MGSLKDKLLARDDLEAGRAVQFALMPAAGPRLPGWEVWLYTRPANDVGGDLVDYLELGAGRIGIALGDVAGKGLGAARLMAKLQSTLRALATGAEPLGELGGRVNRILCRDGIPGRFASLLYLELAAGTGRVRVCNAGHLPPLLLIRGQVRTRRPVAMAGLSAEAAGRRILATVSAFAGEAPASDDISLVILRRLAEWWAGGLRSRTESRRLNPRYALAGSSRWR